MTSDPKESPREFWIYPSGNMDAWPYEADDHRHTLSDIHVIEYSAFLAVKAECAILREANDNCISRGLHESRMQAIEEENAALKSDYGTCDAERDTLKAEVERLNLELIATKPLYSRRKLMEHGKALCEVMEHAIAIGYLNPGGSTEGIFKRVLALHGKFFVEGESMAGGDMKTDTE